MTNCYSMWYVLQVSQATMKIGSNLFLGTIIALAYMHRAGEVGTHSNVYLHARGD